ncbi:separin [Ophiostoma piceae UAMH 11346]|uniref:separase n=1 Tax=Ophiostoma piceae (strain UAMH 11346) TaxID=1262450 RepID=S3CR95_OPHP1|nr:separin [Ophiostoma piceae UAMH 11346]
MATLQLHVEAVRNAVASTATCTPATVVSLKSLLRDAESSPSPPSATTAKPSRAASSSRPATAASSRPGTATAKRRPAATRDDARHDPEPTLSDKEKAQLATHVINAALKALADAAKPTPTPPAAPAEVPPTPKTPARASDDMPPKSTIRGGLRRSMSAPMSPLQPRTLNRVATSPIKPASKSTAAGSGVQTSQCLAAVECARVAFTTLRTLQDSKALALPELQLEAGMSSFVAKLLALNMLDQATRELRILKKRLQGPTAASIPTDDAAAATNVPPKTSKTGRIPKTTTTAARGTTKPTAQTAQAAESTASFAADILDYGDVSDTPISSTKLIVASQLQALRILAALRKSSYTETALPFLRRTYKFSPGHLISLCVKAASANPTEQQKFLRQMESLSQLLLSLAPSIASKEDPNATEPKLSISPLAALELQTLSLETRLRCWAMMPSQKSCDADKDVLGPFSRCLSTYARRSRSSGKATVYSSCRGFFDVIDQLIKHGQFSISRSSKSPLALTYQSLSAMARENAHLEDAIHWSSELLGLMSKTEDSAAKCCSMSAQLLSLQLKTPTKKYPKDIISLLSDVLEAIKGSLKGDTAELEELLANVCLVRKSAVNVLMSQAQSKTNTSTSNVTIPQQTKFLLEAFVYQCPRFCLRWLGKPPAAKSSTKDFLRYEQRRQLLTQSIRHTLDSAFIVTKSMIEEGRMVWEQLDSVLSDSLTVLEYLGDLKGTDASASYFVKISHFYYLGYNFLRRKNADNSDKEALKALRRAIDCIKHRPGPEREKAQLILKLERLADLAKSSGQIGEALGALQSIRSCLVDGGALAQVTTSLSSMPPGLAWATGDQVESLSRTLISIHRLEEVHMDWAYGMDDLEYAAVLEHRLHSIHGKDKLDLAHPCIEALLRIYYPTKYPIRRLRTLLRLFSANLDTADALADIIPQTKAALGLMESQGLADDAALAAYVPHYKTLATSLTGFSEGYPDLEVFQGCVLAWTALMADNPTLAELEQAIDNISEFQMHLHSISEFLRAMGRDSAITGVLELSQTLSNIVNGSCDGRALTMPLVHESAFALSSHYLRTGDSAAAEKILGEIRAFMESNSAIHMGATIRFHLTYAEYLITVGQFDEASKHLLQAKPETQNESTQSQKLGRMSGVQKRLLGAHACFLQSLVALEKGDYSTALQNGRSGVRMLFQDWSRMEKSMSRNLFPTDASLHAEGDDSSADVSASVSMSEAASHASSSPADDPDTSAASTTIATISSASPEFWALFHPLFDSMLRLSSIYAHLGLFQETMYYAEQAQKVAAVTNASLSLSQAEAWLATVHLKAGDLEKAAVFVAQARSRMVNIDQTGRKATLACDLANLYREIGDDDNENEMMQQAEHIVQHVSRLSNTDASKQEDDQEAPTKPATVRRTKAAAATKPAKTTTSKAPARASARKAATTATTTTTVTRTTRKTAVATVVAVASDTVLPSPANALTTENQTMLGLHAILMAQKAMSLLSKKDWATALSILRDTVNNSQSVVPKGQAEILAGHIALAACLLGHSTEQMARDAVFSVIQDSTLSFPAVTSGFALAGGDGTDRLSLGKSPAVNKTRAIVCTPIKSGKTASNFIEMLQEAQDCLIEAQAIAAVSGDSVTLNRISSMLQSAVIVLSATSWSKPRALGHPSYASCSVELARNMTWKRERRAVLVEKAMMTKQDIAGDISWWPAISPASSSSNSMMASARRQSFVGAGSSNAADISINRFQRDYVDIIPRDWSVISMALSENKHDLCITKLQAGQSPFVIRLPLERAISRDADNEVFNFQQGRAELLEIVKAINDSCHGARDMSVKGAKSDWWSEREELDARLKELLDNVEQIWLGGFRGIFSQHVRRPTIFARFQKTFESILDKHLPSRRSPARGKKRGGKASATSAASARVALDPRVLDLFIGLGDASADGCDFDDALDDLLYFVVDILQFHGERNAYDEIEFDAMVVETFDALYAYHTAVRETKSRQSSSAAALDDHLHSILVLDKALHVFPWESLPCMQELAVSRVPSLACLRRLIMDQKQQQQLQQQFSPDDADELKEPEHSSANKDNHRPSGFHASLSSGAYMLNPSGDLPSTETTFDGPLTSSLRGPSWTRIVGREPTEDEFEKILCEKDVMLYFGHGSGAQFIRGRTVRKLDKCRAAALLMGCSSAGLNYNGEFELHGTVWDYMLAGCPAVVGTLWDVTDKDIDRYASQAFEQWGLVPEGAFDEKASKKSSSSSSSKRSGSTTRPSAGKSSLVEALVRARDAPRFRYLTAAAVCVYGIPVYLS